MFIRNTYVIVYSAEAGHTVVDEWWTDDQQIEEIYPEEKVDDDLYSGQVWDYWL